MYLLNISRKGLTLQQLPLDQLRAHLLEFSKRLHLAVLATDPASAKEQAVARSKAIAAALETLETERARAATRRLLIEKKKEMRETETILRVR